MLLETRGSTVLSTLSTVEIECTLDSYVISFDF